MPSLTFVSRHAGHRIKLIFPSRQAETAAGVPFEIASCVVTLTHSCTVLKSDTIDFDPSSSASRLKAHLDFPSPIATANILAEVMAVSPSGALCRTWVVPVHISDASDDPYDDIALSAATWHATSEEPEIRVNLSENVWKEPSLEHLENEFPKLLVTQAKLATSTESDGGEGPQIQIATFPSRNIPDLRRKSQHGVDESLQQASGRGSSTGSHSTNGLTEPRSETEYVTLFTDRRPSASGSQIDYSQPSVKSGTSSHFEARVKTVANVKAVWGSMAVKLSLDNDEDDSVMSSNITDSVLSRGNIENPQSLEVLFGGHVSDEETDIDDRLSVSSAAEPQSISPVPPLFQPSEDEIRFSGSIDREIRNSLFSLTRTLEVTGDEQLSFLARVIRGAMLLDSSTLGLLVDTIEQQSAAHVNSDRDGIVPSPVESSNPHDLDDDPILDEEPADWPEK